MKAAVIQFPGSNADWDAFHALRDVMRVPTDMVFHKQHELPAMTDLVVLPGGFSYGDYLRCGAIARFSPIMAAVQSHAARGGLVLGICNGFQILTESRLLPGALCQNTQLRFECRDVSVVVEADGIFTRGLVGRRLRLPIAHAEGRYVADADTLRELREKKRIAFRYQAPNPNGSIDDIAGIYGGPNANVLGLMPHPERACETLLGSDDGRLLFESVVVSLASRG